MEPVCDGCQQGLPIADDATGLPTGEWDVDLSGRHSFVCSPLPAYYFSILIMRAVVAPQSSQV
jgi:hypothetical protein